MRTYHRSRSVTCTFISMSKRRAPTKSYTESLETRLLMMQRLLEKVLHRMGEMRR